MESIRLRPAEITKHVGLIYGVYIAIGHLAFFWLAWLLGFLDIPELRVLNVVIQGAGIYFALKQHRKVQQGSLNYFRAMSVGFAASAVGTVIFAVVLFFTFQIDHELFETIIRNEPMGRYLTVYMACFAVATEGAISGAFSTYLLMNYMDTDRV
jgi:hypothetical protein